MFRVALCEEGVDRNGYKVDRLLADVVSPSAKRAWIEIDVQVTHNGRAVVALCEEGVDRNMMEEK